MVLWNNNKDETFKFRSGVCVVRAVYFISAESSEHEVVSLRVTRIPVDILRIHISVCMCVCVCRYPYVVVYYYYYYYIHITIPIYYQVAS